MRMKPLRGTKTIIPNPKDCKAQSLRNKSIVYTRKIVVTFKFWYRAIFYLPIALIHLPVVQRY